MSVESKKGGRERPSGERNTERQGGLSRLCGHSAAADRLGLGGLSFSARRSRRARLVYSVRVMSFTLTRPQARYDAHALHLNTGIHHRALLLLSALLFRRSVTRRAFLVETISLAVITIATAVDNG